MLDIYDFLTGDEAYRRVQEAVVGLNMLTPNQSSVETDLTGLAALSGTGTLTRDNEFAAHGSWAMKFAASGSSSPIIGIPWSAGSARPAVVGQAYTGQAEIKQRSATFRNCNVKIYWLNSSFGLISGVTGTASALTSSFAQRVIVTGAAPAGTAYLSFAVDLVGATAGQDFWIEKLMVQTGTSASPWELGSGS